MVFDFDNLIDFVKYYNYENGDKLQDVEDMPLKVRNALREKTWNRSSVSFRLRNLEFVWVFSRNL